MCHLPDCPIILDNASENSILNHLAITTILFTGKPMSIPVEAKSIEQQITEYLKLLPSSRQQQVLHYVQLQLRVQLRDKMRARPVEGWQPGMSAFDVSRDIVGCVEGPGDLSTNPKYMEGFGTL
jgi:hypothetical protein